MVSVPWRTTTPRAPLWRASPTLAAIWDHTEGVMSSLNFAATCSASIGASKPPSTSKRYSTLRVG
jgi:hypothetical protein